MDKEIKKITWTNAKHMMCEFNKIYGIKVKGQMSSPKLEMIAVMTPDSFMIDYTEFERSYKFTNDNKAFMPDALSNSIFASCLDGTDPNVRLDFLVGDEWEVDYCYVLKRDV